jgi:hypothetical protein
VRDVRPFIGWPYAECAPGQFLNYYIVARRTTTLAGSISGQAGLFFQADLRNSIGGGANQSDLDNATLDAWTTFVGSVQISPNTPWEQVAPALVFGSYSLSSGTIQVGRFDAYLL